MSNQNWQEEGVRLAGMLVDAVEIIHAALPQIKDPAQRAEIERFLSARGREPLPSPTALQALEAAVIAALMMQRKNQRG